MAGIIKHIVPDTHFVASHVFSRRRERFPLFERGLPTSDDVVQGALHDCYLLSAVKSFLACRTGPDFVRGMFENRGNWALVRLYDLKGTQPLEIEVQKTEPGTRDSGPFTPNSALWVVMLEKAFAALLRGFSAGIDMKILNFGLVADEVMPPLFGVSASVQMPMNMVPPSLNEPLMELLGVARPAGGFRFATKVHPFVGEGGYFLNSGDLDEYTRWLTREKADQWRALVMDFSRSHRLPFFEEPLDRILNLDDVEAFLKAQRCPERARASILRLLTLEQILPGKRLSGHYTPHMLEVFADIESALRDGRPAMALTSQFLGHPARPDAFWRNPDDKSDVGRGLIPRHIYAIVGAETKGGCGLIHMKNPYELKARQYRTNPINGHTEARGVVRPGAAFNPNSTHTMTFELADFCKRFSTSITADAVPTRSKLA